MSRPVCQYRSIIISLLICCLQVRFALGPYLLNPQDGEDEHSKGSANSSDGERQPLLQDVRPGQTLPAYSNDQIDMPEQDGEQGQVKQAAKKIGYSLKDFRESVIIT